MMPLAFAAALGALVTGAPPDQPGDAVFAEVSILNRDGGRDASAEADLARALLDAGVSIVADSFPGCGYSCVRVVVRGDDSRQFYLEVRSSKRVARGALRLSKSASRFDQAHALAIQIELLEARARADAPVSHRRLAGVAPVPQASVADVPGPSNQLDASEGAPVGWERVVKRIQGDEAPAPSSPLTVMSTPTSPVQPIERSEPRVALGVSLITLIGLSSDVDMVARGIGLEARAPVGKWFDLRVGGALAGAERSTTQGTHSHRGVLPMYTTATIAVPHLVGLRAGTGIEAFFITGDDGGADEPGAWSFGTRTSLAYSHAVRTFAITAAANALFHPMALRTKTATYPPFDVPVWILGLSLGLEFRVL